MTIDITDEERSLLLKLLHYKTVKLRIKISDKVGDVALSETKLKQVKQLMRKVVNDANTTMLVFGPEEED